MGQVRPLRAYGVGTSGMSKDLLSRESKLWLISRTVSLKRLISAWIALVSLKFCTDINWSQAQLVNASGQQHEGQMWPA